ncbi:MAG TPA: tyrosine-type recombinase/integrase [Abditibacteriaceae bacterium]|jgi:site-specific recombinase XerD
MKKRTPAFVNSKADLKLSSDAFKAGEATSRAALFVSVPDLKHHLQDWLYDCQFRQHSPRTTEFRQHTGEKLIWFLERQKCDRCSVVELRQFLAYVANGHLEAGGRWGNPNMKRPVRPATLHRYYRELRTLFSWMVTEDIIPASPVDWISPPKIPSEQIQPFTADQQNALLNASRRSTHPRRDEAIVLFLLDTGARASESCSQRLGDVDLQGQRATIIGKGNKRRTVFFGRRTAKALWQYLREEPRGDDQPIFLADRGNDAGEALTRIGLLRLIQRLGKTSHIQATRCSPHTFRHTFAVEFLRNGGNVFS